MENQSSRVRIKFDFLSRIGCAGKEKSIRIHEKGHRKTIVHFIPIPWVYVVAFAFLNGLTINLVKVVWFRYVGRPHVRATYESVERDLQRILAESDSDHRSASPK